MVHGTQHVHCVCVLLFVEQRIFVVLKIHLFFDYIFFYAFCFLDEFFDFCLRENDVIPAEERQWIKKELAKVKHRKLILKTDQPTSYRLVD